MKDINTYINIKVSKQVFKVPMIIKVKEIDDYNLKIYMSIIYNNKKYIGVGKKYLWDDAFADLQKKLPKGVELACCMTCRYGNGCPFGSAPRILHCTKLTKVKNIHELMNLFLDDNFYSNCKVLYEDYCNDYKPQTNNYFTYNDYRYELLKNERE